MNIQKKQLLEYSGWQVGDAFDFLELSPEEAAIVELKLSLSQSLKSQRISQHLSQDDLAKRMGSSQLRIAKIEAGDPSVSLDILVKALLFAGASLTDVAETISLTQKPGF